MIDYSLDRKRFPHLNLSTWKCLVSAFGDRADKPEAWCELSAVEWLRSPDFGRDSLCRLTLQLKEFGLRLREDTPESHAEHEFSHYCKCLGCSSVATAMQRMEGEERSARLKVMEKRARELELQVADLRDAIRELKGEERTKGVRRSNPFSTMSFGGRA